MFQKTQNAKQRRFSLPHVKPQNTAISIFYGGITALCLFGSIQLCFICAFFFFFLKNSKFQVYDIRFQNIHIHNGTSVCFKKTHRMISTSDLQCSISSFHSNTLQHSTI